MPSKFLNLEKTVIATPSFRTPIELLSIEALAIISSTVSHNESLINDKKLIQEALDKKDSRLGTIKDVLYGHKYEVVLTFQEYLELGKPLFMAKEIIYKPVKR